MKKSIKKNYLYNLIYQILTIIIPIITAPYLARVLGVKGTGVTSYTLSIVSYFIIFGSIGVSSYGQREIAMNRDDKNKCSKLFWELFLLKLVTSVLSILGYIFLIVSSTKYNVIYFILTLNILASIFDISWFFQGFEEYKFISIRNIIIKTLFTISIFVFVKNKNDLNLYILLNGLSLLISSLSLWIRLPKMINKISLKKINVFSHLKNSLIYFLPQIATQIYTMLDKTMLGIITKGEIENGYYEQAYKIVTMSLTVITSLNTVMSPRMSYLYKEKKHDEIKEKLFKSLQFTFFLGVPMMSGIACTAYGMVDWFYGFEYEKVKLLLVVFSPIIIIIALSGCLGGQYLTPCGKRLQSAGALWVGAIINFLLNLILIPKYASLGAAISSVIAELIITILYFVLSKEYVDVKKMLKKFYKYFIASIIMSIVILFLYHILKISILSTVIEIITGIIVYILVLLILKDDMIYYFLNLIKRKVLHYEKI